jgi:hypothetical protein
VKPAAVAALVATLPWAAARAADAPWRFGGELMALVQASSVEGVALHSYGLRLALGANGPPTGLAFGDELGWVVSLTGSLGESSHGLPLRDGRLGLGARLRFGRITAGLEAEGVLLSIRRTSLPGTLTGTGVGGRALVAVDLFRERSAALVAAVDGGLAMVGSISASDASWVPDIRAALGVRW